MKKIFLILFALNFLNSQCISQDKHDYIWLSGYHRVGLTPPGTMLDFNSDSVVITATPLLGALGESAVMSDKNGSLLFYTDGCNIVNAIHQTMANGDSLNGPSGAAFHIDCSRDSIGYGLRQGIIALPYPSKEHEFIIFHITKSRDDYNPDQIRYSIVDMTLGNGLGQVTQKNHVLVDNGSFADCITAVKHGNGRDWWVVIPDGEEEDVFHLLLLTPNGVQIFKQKMNFNKQAFPKTFNQAVFSPDGTKYARITGEGYLLQMCFDRCSGQFSCPKITQIYSQHTGGGGIAFSPNSRFLYISFYLELFQLDTEGENAQPILIDRYDGFVKGFPATFFRMSLAPDNKIYMCCTNGIRVMHVIEKPDEPGPACDFRQHGISLPTPNSIGMNNFPFFRLYDQPFSICDTLGIDAPPGIDVSPGWVPASGLSIHPNPAQNCVYIALAACSKGRMRIINSRGQIIYEERDWLGPKSLNLDVSDWASGIYIIQIHKYESLQYVKKFIVMH